MKLITLGTGGCFATPSRNAAGALVQLNGDALLVDVGENTWRALARSGVEVDDISTIFLTHYHVDHIGGLAPLLFGLHANGKRTKPLVVYGPPPIADLRSGLRLAYGAWIDDPGFPLEWRQLEPPGRLEWNASTVIEFERVEHAAHLICLGFRITEQEKTLVISGDTNICEGLRLLMKNADALLVEAGNPDAEPNPGHVTPTALGRLATAEGVRRVILTHFSDPALAADLTTATQKAFGGEVVAAEDGDEFIV